MKTKLILLTGLTATLLLLTGIAGAPLMAARTINLVKLTTEYQVDPLNPGYKSIIIKPHPGSTMNDVKAAHMTAYGEVGSAWKTTDGKIRMEVKIPVNTTAILYVPTSGSVLTINGNALKTRDKIPGPGYDYAILKKGSGSYLIEADL